MVVQSGLLTQSPTKLARSGLLRSQSDVIPQPLSGEISDERNTADLPNQIGILELLQEDGRPTFILDVADAHSLRPGSFQPIFVNIALESRPILLQQVLGDVKDGDQALASPSAFVDFKKWTLSYTQEGEALAIALPPYIYGGFLWSGLTLRKRFRVLSCGLNAPSPNGGSPKPADVRHYRGLGLSSARIKPDGYSYFDQSDPSGYSPATRPTSDLVRLDSNNKAKDRRVRSDASDSPNRSSTVPRKRIALSKSRPALDRIDLPSPLSLTTSQPGVSDKASSPAHGYFDWTRLPPSPSLPHIQFALSVDWAATSLGPIQDWSPHLRMMCNLLMASPNPAALYWGPDMVTIYNEAYILLAGAKHPHLMGMTYEKAWHEIWDDLKDILGAAYSEAQATMKDNDKLFMNRDGFLEETYFTWSIIPLIGADGSVAGLYNPAFENTRRVIAERQMFMLREIGESTASARQVSEFWPLVLQGLEKYEIDAPFAIIYSVADGPDSGASSPISHSSARQKNLIIQGTLGVSVGHRAAPAVIEINASDQGFAAAFRSAAKLERPIILSNKDGTLDQELLQDITWRGFGDPCSTVVIFPVRPIKGGVNLGFVVFGTNPRRPFDEDYNLFVQLFARQLTTSIASVLVFEEEMRRNERAARLAAQDRIELSNQLAARTQEAVESEAKFTRMAEMAPVGIFIASAEGNFNFCNDAWYDLCSYPKGGAVGPDWLDCVVEEDRALATKEWQDFLDQKAPLTSVFRFNTPWKDREGNEMTHTWVLVSAHPEVFPDGRVKRIFGSVTDVSNQKRAEDLQKRRMEEAVETKRAQEQFIDLICHEMRNPLSAILQCADEISNSLLGLSAIDEVRKAIVQDSIDAAQTVTLCAQHQKRIVDDVLTLSKLDSARLVVFPVDKEPASVVEHVLRMFEGEAQTAGIALDFQVDESLRTLNVGMVRLDPSRLLQVLINLTTNAIKFTTSQKERSIQVRLGASLQRPSELAEAQVDYIPSRTTDRDTASAPEWGTGEVLYLTFAIQDTGRGLTEDEKKLLFMRFSQTSRLTHINYGGSGLGLFICRELVELQGGEIGVASEAGKGSTFAFYIKVRRSLDPVADSQESRPALHSSKLSATGSSKSFSATELVPSHRGTPQGSAPPAHDELLTVLIVEDNLVNQRVLAKQLKARGCIIHLANHGGEAIDVLMKSWFWKGCATSKVQIDVVLMDMEMPVMDGLSCTRRIRELEVDNSLTRHVPVIAVTANARAEQIESTREAGVDDVMSKPFRIPELLPKIRALAQKYRKGSAGPS